jgi:hypothetical protein
MDEAAHMQQEGDSYQTAAKVYDALSPSLLQFGKHSLCMLNSSPYTKVGKYYEKYTEALAVKDDKPVFPQIFAFQYPSWCLYADYYKYPKHKNDMLPAASPDWDEDEVDENGEYIHNDSVRDLIVITRGEELSNPEKFKVENRSQWAEVMDAYLRPEMVDQAFLGRPDANGNCTALRTNFNHPQAGHTYVCHLDPSSTTAGFGFAMAHTEEIARQDPTSETHMDTHIVFDIVKRWQPNQFAEGTIDPEIVLDEIGLWIKIFRPVEVSTDQFQSSMIISWLNKFCREHGLSGTQIAEKTATPQANYYSASRTKDALNMGLIHFPSDTADCDWLALEMKNLQIINSAGRYPKIDCPSVGPVQTKDIWSAVSELTYSLIGDVVAQDARAMLGEMKPALGASGGYNLGGQPLQRRSLSEILGRAGGGSPMGGENPSDMVNYGTWAMKGRRR